MGQSPRRRRRQVASRDEPLVPALYPHDDDLAQLISDAQRRFRKLGKSSYYVSSELAAFELMRAFMDHSMTSRDPFDLAARGLSPEQAWAIYELVFLLRLRKAKAGCPSAVHDVAMMRMLDLQSKIDFVIPDYLYGQHQRKKLSEGGRKSKRQRNPDVIAACQNIRASESGITCRTAFKRMTTGGHRMPDGKLVRFEGAETTFQRFWTEAGRRLSR